MDIFLAATYFFNFAMYASTAPFESAPIHCEKSSFSRKDEKAQSSHAPVRAYSRGDITLAKRPLRGQAV